MPSTTLQPWIQTYFVASVGAESAEEEQKYKAMQDNRYVQILSVELNKGGEGLNKPITFVVTDGQFTITADISEHCAKKYADRFQNLSEIVNCVIDLVMLTPNIAPSFDGVKLNVYDFNFVQNAPVPNNSMAVDILVSSKIKHALQKYKRAFNITLPAFSPRPTQTEGLSSLHSAQDSFGGDENYLASHSNSYKKERMKISHEVYSMLDLQHLRQEDTSLTLIPESLFQPAQEQEANRNMEIDNIWREEEEHQRQYQQSNISKNYENINEEAPAIMDFEKTQHPYPNENETIIHSHDVEKERDSLPESIPIIDNNTIDNTKESRKTTNTNTNTKTNTTSNTHGRVSLVSEIVESVDSESPKGLSSQNPRLMAEEQIIAPDSSDETFHEKEKEQQEMNKTKGKEKEKEKEKNVEKPSGMDSDEHEAQFSSPNEEEIRQIDHFMNDFERSQEYHRLQRAANEREGRGEGRNEEMKEKSSHEMSSHKKKIHRSSFNIIESQPNLTTTQHDPELVPTLLGMPYMEREEIIEGIEVDEEERERERERENMENQTIFSSNRDILTVCKEDDLLKDIGSSLNRNESCVGNLTIGDLIRVRDFVARMHQEKKQKRVDQQHKGGRTLEVFKQMDFIRESNTMMLQ